MKNLLPRLRKFSSEIFPEHRSLFEDLASGQKPHTLMITCSDSRIDPNLVTQTQPGELFVLRNAGNIVPPYGSSKGGEEAAIEFAIDGLGVRNIVICGHSHCGAMAGLMNKVDLTALPSVKAWLSHAEATKRRMSCKHNGDSNLTSTIEENVLVQANNLKTHPSVSAALSRGRVRIFGWVYHFENGSVTVYDKLDQKFVMSSEVPDDVDEELRLSL